MDPVIDAPDMARLGPVRLLDLRALAAVEADPVEDAIRVPIEEWVEIARNDERAFDQVRAWQDRIAALDLGPGATAMIFDGGEMTEAARIWFILQYFGVSALVLNGGRAALRDGPAPRTAPPPAEPWTAQPGSGEVALMDRGTLRRSLDGVQVLDARTEGEFRGDDSRGNQRSGHIPQARLLSHAHLFEDSRLRPPEALRHMLTEAGFTPGAALVTHCQGGGRAALAALAAMRAGFEDVRVYYRSFGDWAADESCPVVHPT